MGSGTNLEISKEAQVGRQLVCGRTEAGQRRQNVNIDFSRVRLRRHGVRIAESRQGGDPAIKLLYLIPNDVLLPGFFRVRLSVPCRGLRRTA